MHNFFEEAFNVENDLIATELKKKFDESLEFKQQSSTRNSVWVSHLYCPRAAVLDADSSGFSKVGKTSSVFMKMGVAIEEIAMNNFENMGALIFPKDKQLYVSDVSMGLENDFSGKVDGLMKLEFGGKSFLYALEIKTCGVVPAKPKPEHFNQLMIYSGVTGLKPILFYFSRIVTDYTGELLNVFFVYDYDKEVITKEMAKLFYAIECKQNNLIPNIVDVKKSYCKYCNFHKSCRVNEVYKDIPEEHYQRSYEKAQEYMSNENLQKRFDLTLKEILSKNPKAKSILKNIDRSHLV